MILTCPGQLARFRHDIGFGLPRVQGRVAIQATDDLALTRTNSGCLAGPLVTVVGGVVKIGTATASFGRVR